MAAIKIKLRALRNELQFLDKGGYRTPILWRSARVFEDSLICPKDAWSACPHEHCALLDFVPEPRRQETIPCRHIPLNERGESLATLYNTATNEEIVETVRTWLLNTVAELDRMAQAEEKWSPEKAG